MPRFFFHIHNGREILDDTGTEHANVEAARVAAVHYIGDVIAESAKEFWDAPEMRLEAVDEANQVRFALHLIGLDRPTVAASPNAEGIKLG